MQLRKHAIPFQSGPRCLSNLEYLRTSFLNLEELSGSPKTAKIPHILKIETRLTPNAPTLEKDVAQHFWRTATLDVELLLTDCYLSSSFKIAYCIAFQYICCMLNHLKWWFFSYLQERSFYRTIFVLANWGISYVVFHIGFQAVAHVPHLQSWYLFTKRVQLSTAVKLLLGPFCNK